jgi:flagellar hook-length control protein FliK
VSQALPVLPQLAVLDGRKPDLRPVEVGNHGNHQTFDRLLDRFVRRDVAKDTAKERTCEPPAEKKPAEAVAADGSAGAPEDTPAADAVAKPDPATQVAEPAELAVATPPVTPPTPALPVIAPTVAEPLPAPAVQPAETAAPAAAPAVAAIPQQPVAAVRAPDVAGNAAPTGSTEPAAIAVAPAAETTAQVFAMGGAAMPAAQPQVMRMAAAAASPGSKPAAAKPETATGAAPAEAIAARAPLAKATAPAPAAEPADPEQQIRLEGKPAVAPAAAVAAAPVAAAGDERGAAGKTPEQLLAAVIVDTPRSAAAQYHKVAETVRTGAAAAETPALAEQVSIRLLHAVAEGKRTIQVHLHPAELGSIDVKMQWQGDRLTAQFQVDRPETLVLLQREVPALERTLNQAGVNVDSGSLSFSLRQQTGNGQNGNNGQPFDPAAAGAAFGESVDRPLGDEPLGQVIRDGILSIRV